MAQNFLTGQSWSGATPTHTPTWLSLGCCLRSRSAEATEAWSQELLALFSDTISPPSRCAFCWTRQKGCCIDVMKVDEIPQFEHVRVLRVPGRQANARQFLTRFLAILASAAISAFILLRLTAVAPQGNFGQDQSIFAGVQQCAIDNFQANLSFLDGAVPIKAEEFLERRDRLARALAVNGVDAFALEPGYTFQYVPDHTSKSDSAS
jgi:hypothetical protein